MITKHSASAVFKDASQSVFFCFLQFQFSNILVILWSLKEFSNKAHSLIYKDLKQF